jgi:hypothetical protein
MHDDAGVAVFIVHDLDHIVGKSVRRRSATTVSGRTGRLRAAAEAAAVTAPAAAAVAVKAATAVSGRDVRSRSSRAGL